MNNEEMLSVLHNASSFVVFDTESTHFNPVKKDGSVPGKLLEIGAVKIVDDKIVETFDELINPERKIPKNITELTHITDEMVKNKRTYPYALSNFYRFAKGSVLVMHNAQHDLRFLNYFGEEVGLKFDECSYIDTWPLAKQIIPQGNRKNPYSLKSLAEYLGIDDESHHRASNDAEVTAKLLLELKKRSIDNKLNVEIKYLGSEDDALLEQSTIAGVNIWQKKFKNKNYCRAYVTLKCSDKQNKYAKLFWDFETHQWGGNESMFPITNFQIVENKMLQHTNRTNKSLVSLEAWNRKE